MAVAQPAKQAHEKWMESQGIPIIRDFAIPSLKEIAVDRWDRLGCNGAYVVLDGCEATNDAYVLEIPAGKDTIPEHHLFEEVIYVLSGRGAATIWNEGGEKRTFEWQEGSLFAIPLNAWHKFFNGQGDSPARMYVVSTAPLVMNLYHNFDFIFNDNFIFTDRYDGGQDFFNGEGTATVGRVWHTNFVADVRSFPLMEWKERGAGGNNRFFELGDGTLTAHTSEFPVATYKKGHRHGPGAHVIIVKGEGYSLLWLEGKERVKVPWRVGSVLVPPDKWFHQHFNSGAEPARYLAIRWGSRKYPLWAGVQNDGTKADVSLKLGGNQIEYEDEDPAIRQLFEEELAQKGLKCALPPVARNIG